MAHFNSDFKSEVVIDKIMPLLVKLLPQLTPEEIAKECRHVFKENGALVLDEKEKMLKVHFNNKYKLKLK